MISDEGIDLPTWLAQAQDRHPETPREVAAGLLARAATLPDDEFGAQAVHLAEHVMLGHLADAASLQRLLDALPPRAALQPARDRAAWALAMVAGQAPASVLPASARWRALLNGVLMLAATGRWAEAAAALRQPEAQALTHERADARKAYAATANNVALELREAWLRRPRVGDPAEGAHDDAAHAALMLEAATLSRRAWAAAGTWLHVERAEYQLALCHAIVGQGPQGVLHAQACLAICDAEGADAVERFFAHEALVRAHRAAGDTATAEDSLGRMQALLAEIDDPEMHAWCTQTLAALRP